LHWGERDRLECDKSKESEYETAEALFLTKEEKSSMLSRHKSKPLFGASILREGNGPQRRAEAKKKKNHEQKPKEKKDRE
jgi:hypothetical protein